MTGEQFVFLLAAVITLGSALMVVTAPNMVRSALWLVLALFGVAILYALLNSGFFAVVQVVVYIGAIAILFIFAVMLTRRVMDDPGPQTNPGWWASALVAFGLFGTLAFLLSRWQQFGAQAPALTSDTESLTQLGAALVSPNGYVIPFEVASVLLVAAMVGAIYVVWGKGKTSQEAAE